MSAAPWAVRVDGLGKEYELGEHAGRPRSLYETLSDVLARVAGRGSGSSTRGERLWALRDVEFEIAQGEVLGVIGPNGAGKSTLLKILSRITTPTTGRVTLRGKLASLLEVGTGFHPELTGRENIYLNGTILGMRRREIDRKFDDIVGFAEVEKFLDTPVKRYSSGMYVRLAFAVAAHLDTDILLVDEVLAVGDASFQRRSLGKMEDVARSGRTVLFVSHNMTAIHQLCHRALLFEKGRVTASGPASRIVQDYLAAGMSEGTAEWPVRAEAPGGGLARIRAVRVISEGEVRPVVPIDRPVRIEVDFWLLADAVQNFCVNVYLRDARDMVVLSSANTDAASLRPTGWFRARHEAGLYRASCEIPANFLGDLRYFVSVYLVTTSPIRVEASAERAVVFSVHDTGSLREAGMEEGEWHGVVRPALDWRTDRIGE